MLTFFGVNLKYNNFKYLYTIMNLEIQIPQFQPYKDKIPEFVIKLYHILQKKQYSDYLCWYGNNEILIKHPKKLQQKVLPHFFRHKHMSSFIRQLNMYRFNKVTKITKQKNYMYFRNQHFVRGNIKQLIKIKRNIKKNRQTEQTVQIKQEQNQNFNQQHQHQNDNSENVSINERLRKVQQIEPNRPLQQYKEYVKLSVSQIYRLIEKASNTYPDSFRQLRQAKTICEDLLQIKREMPHSNSFGSSSANQDPLNMLNGSMKALPRIQSIIMPSQCSFYHFNGL